MKTGKQEFRAVLFGRDGRNAYQVWESLQYPRLQIWVFLRIGKPGIFRQFRVEDWDPEIETLEDAIRIAKLGKKKRCIGLPRTYVYRGPVDDLSSVISKQKLRSSDIQHPMGSNGSPRDQRNKRKKIIIKSRKLHNTIRDRARQAEAEIEERSFHKVRPRKERSRLLRRAR
jgi:hypothetical protein